MYEIGTLTVREPHVAAMRILVGQRVEPRLAKITNSTRAPRDRERGGPSKVLEFHRYRVYVERAVARKVAVADEKTLLPPGRRARSGKNDAFGRSGVAALRCTASTSFRPASRLDELRADEYGPGVERGRAEASAPELRSRSVDAETGHAEQYSGRGR